MSDLVSLISRILLSAVFIVYGYIKFINVDSILGNPGTKKFMELVAGGAAPPTWLGYLIAAAGPVVVGALHEATGSWSLSIIVLMAILVPQALSGIGAGRARTLAERLGVAGQASAI